MKVAAYTGTSNLYPMMYTAVKSLLMHSDVDKVYLLIEDDEFPYELPDIVRTINVKYQKFFYPDGANWRSRFSYMAMMRATYAKMFPKLDRILSLDVDTIVTEDISDLWDLPIDDYYLSASEEPKATKEHGYFYVNIGVALYNLNKLREDRMVDKVIGELNSKQYAYLEQDAFSELCHDRIYPMPPEYNYTEFTSPSGKPKIVHYAGIREWTDKPEYIEYEKIPISEIKISRKTKKNIPKYMIHTYPGRKWYVDEFLVPSMLKQGIPKEDITIWNDSEGLGNLESCIRSFESLPDQGGTWHLQDDVIISSRFSEMTREHDEGLVCGFCNDIFDGKTVDYAGYVPIDCGWFSFQCNRIPNEFAKQFAKWYREEVVPKKLFPEFTKDGKCDDSLWQRFAWRHLQGELPLNLEPNIVDHIDYLIGGTSINFHRNGELRRAYYWNEEDAVRQLETELAKRKV